MKTILDQLKTIYTDIDGVRKKYKIKDQILIVKKYNLLRNACSKDDLYQFKQWIKNDFIDWKKIYEATNLTNKIEHYELQNEKDDDFTIEFKNRTIDWLNEAEKDIYKRWLYNKLTPKEQKLLMKANK